MYGLVSYTDLHCLYSYYRSMRDIMIEYWNFLFSLSRPKRAIEKNAGYGTSQKCHCSKEGEYG